jgi:orotate phosphoribosyltransferase
MPSLYTPVDKETIAREAAKMLLEIKAVHFYDEKPFFFTSGWASPVYIDCRKIISYPRLRSSLIDFAAATIVRDIGYESIDTVAGGETAGIPFAAWISDRLMLPMQYVRKKAKGFGRNAQIEGEVETGARTLLVEILPPTVAARSIFVRRFATLEQPSTIVLCCSTMTFSPRAVN